MRILFVVLSGLWLAFSAPPVARYRHHGAALLPDRTATPGKTVPITKEKLCGTAWGKDARHVTDKMKAAACVAYGLRPHCYGAATNEIDHLVSRELGGADDPANLWPQPYNQHPGAHEKDAVENWLHRQVCANQLSLRDAQAAIADDWYAVYLRAYPAKP